MMRARAESMARTSDHVRSTEHCSFGHVQDPALAQAMPSNDTGPRHQMHQFSLLGSRSRSSQTCIGDGLPVVQPKLRIGAANDACEAEADRMSKLVVNQLRSGQTDLAASHLSAAVGSDTVVRHQNPAVPAVVMRAGINLAQPASAATDLEPTAEFTGALQQSRGSGQPIPESARVPMERAFATDFRDVKIHQDARADRMASQIQARAFTSGTDIFIRRGEDSLSSRGGQSLLAHELTHVLQQGAAQTYGSPSPCGQTCSPRADPCIQRALSFDQTIAGVQSVRVSDGGALGVIFITDGTGPPLVVKPEPGHAAAAIRAAQLNNVAPDIPGWTWSTRTPRARLATPTEVANILAAMQPGHIVGKPDRVVAMSRYLRDHGGEIVIYECASGQEFIETLRDGPQAVSRAHKQSHKGQRARVGSGLELLGDPNYVKQLGRVAVIDVLLGNFDRLAGAVNFENWMSDSATRTISLVDNDSSLGGGQAYWQSKPEVGLLSQRRFADFTAHLIAQLEQVLFDPGYGGGALRPKDQQYWQTIKDRVTTNLRQGAVFTYHTLFRFGGGEAMLRRVARNQNDRDSLQHRLTYLSAGLRR